MSSPIYTLRDAKGDDLEFLFGVVIAVRQSQELFSWNMGRSAFEETFGIESTQVIQYHGKDVGRLRVEREPSYTYVGGLQILPAYQRKGIGSAIIVDLAAESKRFGVPLTLDVAVENIDAQRLYYKLGFVKAIEEIEKGFIPLILYST